jgi:hypothetical protein
MTADKEVIRAARNLITEHAAAAESVALTWAKRATESNNDSVASRWRQIAAAVKELQERG